MKCQVLYDLRDCSCWISGKKLHNLFIQLVDDPSPSGGCELNPDNLDKETKTLLEKRVYSVIKTRNNKWVIVKTDLSIEEASQIAFENGRFEITRTQELVSVVPRIALPYLEGFDKNTHYFEDGCVITPDDLFPICQWY